MSTIPAPAPAPLPRHALGLPAGSIRALLAAGVLGYLWLLVLPISKEGGRPIQQPEAAEAFTLLQLLVVMMLAHFFVAHGRTIGRVVSDRSPLSLPRGSLRFLLLAAEIGLLYYAYVTELSLTLPTTQHLAVYLGVLLVAFILGHGITDVVRGLSGGWLPAWFQDIQAWFALIALILLGVLVLIRLVMNTSVPFDRQVGLVNMEIALAGIVSFYFGARS